MMGVYRCAIELILAVLSLVFCVAAVFRWVSPVLSTLTAAKACCVRKMEPAKR